MSKQSHRFRFLLGLAGLLLASGLVVVAVCQLVAEWLWFEPLGYLQVFWQRFQVLALIGTIVPSISLGFLLGNLALAQRWSHAGRSTDSDTAAQSRPLPGAMGLRWLLFSSGSLALGLVFLCLNYAQLTIAAWRSMTIEGASPPNMLSQDMWNQLWQLGLALSAQPWWWVLVGMLSLGILLWPSVILSGIAVLLGLGLTGIWVSRWETLLLYFHPQFLQQTEPLFQQDIGLYLFKLGGWEMLGFWLLALTIVALSMVGLTYILANNSLSQGKFPGFSTQQQRHLYNLGGGLALVLAFNHWLSRYELLYSARGVIYGASYADVKIQLPMNTLMMVLAIGVALQLFWWAMRSKSVPRKPPLPRRTKIIQPLPSQTDRWRQPLPPLTLRPLILGYLALTVVLTYLLPLGVHNLIVQPNELEREQPYVLRSIALTRQAFGLDEIEVKTFDPQANLSFDDLQRHSSTIRNIRLWDTRPLLETNRQLQQIRLYYKFPDANIDRYRLRLPAIRGQGTTTELQQVIIAARELDYNGLPNVAKTWVNEHLVYTHGYGFTLSPVNTVGPGGLPDYFVKDIAGYDSNQGGNLTTANEDIRASIPIGHPRIYYGNLTNTYVMAPSQVQELDYPSGNINVYNTYDGKGGVSVSSLWRRWLFAIYLRDWQMVLTRNFKPDTKILFRRNIRQRVEAIAPFLSYDDEPYLVVANAGLIRTKTGLTDSSPHLTSKQSENYLYWIIDAYTTSDRYPYSDPGDRSFNYIRNSVKVVVDAYNGSMDFYVADPEDPLIQAWQAIFPGLFKPLQEMPITLQSHIRYPVNLFNVQSERLLTYHMEDPQVFYNREDQWQIPSEVYGGKSQPVEAYYLIMQLPETSKEEFILLRPFTPTGRNNLIGWLASRSDGQNYGKLLLYQFPKQRLVFGPEQIEARINQEPNISQQISLWNQEGSRTVQGNLLVIPIEQSLLYVEPLYLEAERTSLPTLVRVITAYGDRIAMEPTLEASLKAVFQNINRS